MRVIQSASFRKKVHRLGSQEKRILDSQIHEILKHPRIGQEKKGDLKGVFVHKFKMHSTQYLLTYRFVSNTLELIMLGPHENYYRDLSKHMKAR